MSSEHGFFGVLVGSAGGDWVVEGHDDIGAKVQLSLGGNFGGEKLGRAVQMGFEISPLVCDFGGEAHDLKASRIGQNRMGPVHKCVDTA